MKVLQCESNNKIWFPHFLWKIIITLCRWIYVNIVRLWSRQVNTPSLKTLQVLHKTEHFVVINKEPDVKINSNDPADTITVETQLRHTFPDFVSEKAAHGFRFIHRLDYATSGVLCIAFTKKGAQWGNKAFAKRDTTKHYLALVWGHLDKDKYHRYCIDVDIGNDSSVSDVHKMCTPSSSHCTFPRSAVTSVTVLQHGLYNDQPASKLLLIPQTGRTHQLRVHCLYIGHRIVGDYMYSNRTDVSPYRMMLHAYRLIIPMSHCTIDVTAPDPFTPDTDSKWTVLKTFFTYVEYVDEYGLKEAYS